MQIDRAALELAASLAGASRHPLARALCLAAPGVPVASSVEEIAGRGLRLATSEGEVRLGNREWCAVAETSESSSPELWLARPGRDPVRFAFVDPLRPDAGEVIGELKRRGLGIELLSGDRAPAVARAAAALDIQDWRGACTPADKAARLRELADAGRRVLMVGDGLNDAPALAGAHVSLSPSSALDISQNAADAVFQGERLRPVVEVLEVARRAARLIRQNLGLALAYNVVVVPLAMLGMVTPLVAAICMSASSLIVVGNSLRLRGRS
jgi:Cu2+-exporting ATPase